MSDSATKKEQHQVSASKSRTRIVAEPPPLPKGAVTSDQLAALGDKDATAFMRRVFDAQVRLKWAAKQQRKDKDYYFNLPMDVLQPVSLNGQETRFRLHENVLPLFCRLFEAIQLARRNPKCDVQGANLVREIGLASAYRTLEDDTRAWQAAFSTHYKNLKREIAKTRSKYDGDCHGAKAFNEMLRRMLKYKAPPGFSNHTRGIAVDFSTTQFLENHTYDKDQKKWISGYITLGASSAQKPNWRRTWLYQWLTKHANNPYRFTRLPTEEWHWEHVD